ncbi:MAG: hypothetical protein HQK79_19855 [Desulfobacterales bacterium]|nr:hypothetical protein [Desulfobacterales bacterium]
MKWFKIHFDIFEKEVKELQSNSNYNEIFSARDNIFVSSGEIIVRMDKVIRYPILIVYLESTPFSLPKVYLLNTPLQSQKIQEISKLESLQVPEMIKNNIKFYHRRH